MSDEIKSQPVLLTSVSEIFAFARRGLGVEASAVLYGLIVRVTDRGGIVFSSLTDGSGRIQLIANKANFSLEVWKEIQSIKPGDRIRARGTVGPAKGGKTSLFLRDLPDKIFGSESSIIAAWPEWQFVSHQIVLAKVRKVCAASLEQSGFRELEPRLLSRAWAGGKLSALQVLYPGFGMPMYLVPSPSSQLLRTMVTIGSPRIFCISRCFTAEFRDIADGTETVIVHAKWLNPTIDEILDLSEAVVSDIFSDESLGFELKIKRFPRHSRGPWPPTGNLPESGDSPFTEIFDQFQTRDELFGRRNVLIFRIKCMKGNGPAIVVADGTIDQLTNDIRIANINWHADRIAQFGSDASVRRLASLGWI
jgi:lysyl-tRNA synthetase class II